VLQEKDGDSLNKHLSQEIIFLATTLTVSKHFDLKGEPETWNSVPYHQVWIYPSV